MQVGNLVKHKRTGSIGMVIRVPKESEYYFDVEWFGGTLFGPGKCIFGALVVISESR